MDCEVRKGTNTCAERHGIAILQPGGFPESLDLLDPSAAKPVSTPASRAGIHGMPVAGILHASFSA
jgi:hypothetical protein